MRCFFRSGVASSWRWAALSVALSVLIAVAAPRAVAHPDGPSTKTGPAMWRIADDDNTVWLLGSMHMLPPNVEWRRPEIEDALRAAEIVFFEVSLDPESLLRARSLMRVVGLNPPGQRLSAQLSPRGRERLARLAPKIRQAPYNFEPMRPWLAFLTLETGVFAAAGAAASAGVDQEMERRARDRGKTVRYFETATEQIRILSDLPTDTQLALLEHALEAFDANPDIGDGLFSAWRRGDAEALAALVFAQEAAFPDYFDALFHTRNQAWASKIDAMLRAEADVFVVVGAGHLVGPRSVPALLKARGWRVERY